MIDWELAIATAVAFGVLVFILRCLWVLLFARVEGEKVEPTEISVVDLFPFQNPRQRSLGRKSVAQGRDPLPQSWNCYIAVTCP